MLSNVHYFVLHKGSKGYGHFLYSRVDHEPTCKMERIEALFESSVHIERACQLLFRETDPVLITISELAISQACKTW
jgi:hypothetical protein